LLTIVFVGADFFAFLEEAVLEERSCLFATELE
jgi:hypothetical protein